MAADESGCTPGSVARAPRGRRGDGHPSRTGVAAGLVRSTRGLGRAALERPRRAAFTAAPLDLAPGGVYLAAQVTLGAGGLLHHRFTLTERPRPRRSVFCGTVPRVTPGGRYPPPCPVEPGRSSAEIPKDLDAAARPARLPCDHATGPGGAARTKPVPPPSALSTDRAVPGDTAWTARTPSFHGEDTVSDDPVNPVNSDWWRQAVVYQVYPAQLRRRRRRRHRRLCRRHRPAAATSPGSASTPSG